MELLTLRFPPNKAREHIFFGRPAIIHKNNETKGKFYWKWLILGLKAEKQLRNKNNTKDWALGCHPRDNGHVTH